MKLNMGCEKILKRVLPRADGHENRR
jgi:hypothetical protein